MQNNKPSSLLNLTFLTRKRKPFKPSPEPFSDNLIVDSTQSPYMHASVRSKTAADKVNDNPLPLLSDQYKRNTESIRYRGRREEGANRGWLKAAVPMMDYQKSNLASQVKT